MANVLDKFMQKGENEGKSQEQNYAMSKKAYSNVMAYIKELKADYAKGSERVEQTYVLSKNSTERLKEMQAVLDQWAGTANQHQDAEELLKRIGQLQRQIGNITTMLRNVYEKQDAVIEAKQEDCKEMFQPGILDEEWSKMQDEWKQFESQIGVRLDNQETQLKRVIQLGLSEPIEEVKRVIEKSNLGQSEEIKRVIEEGNSRQTEEVKHAIEQRDSGQAEEIKRVIEEGNSRQTEEVKHAIEQSNSGQAEEIKRIIEEMNSGQIEEVKQAMEERNSGQVEEVKRVMEEGQSSQKVMIASAIQEQMYGFRSDLAEAVRDEIQEYNNNVKDMTMNSQHLFEESLENHERIIKKEILLVQEMLENTLEEYQEKTLEKINHVKKVTKGYARMAMLASFLALIILFMDILVLK